jgi:hypothetical protein
MAVGCSVTLKVRLERGSDVENAPGSKPHPSTMCREGGVMGVRGPQGYGHDQTRAGRAQHGARVSFREVLGPTSALPASVRRTSSTQLLVSLFVSNGYQVYGLAYSPGRRRR